MSGRTGRAVSAHHVGSLHRTTLCAHPTHASSLQDRHNGHHLFASGQWPLACIDDGKHARHDALSFPLRVIAAHVHPASATRRSRWRMRLRRARRDPTHAPCLKISARSASDLHQARAGRGRAAGHETKHAIYAIDTDARADHVGNPRLCPRTPRQASNDKGTNGRASPRPRDVGTCVNHAANSVARPDSFCPQCLFPQAIRNRHACTSAQSRAPLVDPARPAPSAGEAPRSAGDPLDVATSAREMATCAARIHDPSPMRRWAG